MLKRKPAPPPEDNGSSGSKAPRVPFKPGPLKPGAESSGPADGQSWNEEPKGVGNEALESVRAAAQEAANSIFRKVLGTEPAPSEEASASSAGCSKGDMHAWGKGADDMHAWRKGEDDMHAWGKGGWPGWKGEWGDWGAYGFGKGCGFPGLQDGFGKGCGFPELQGGASAEWSGQGPPPLPQAAQPEAPAFAALPKSGGAPPASGAMPAVPQGMPGQDQKSGVPIGNLMKAKVTPQQQQQQQPQQQQQQPPQQLQRQDQSPQLTPEEEETIRLQEEENMKHQVQLGELRRLLQQQEQENLQVQEILQQQLEIQEAMQKAQQEEKEAAEAAENMDPQQKAYYQMYMLAQVAEEAASTAATASAWVASPDCDPHQAQALAQTASDAESRSKWAQDSMAQCFPNNNCLGAEKEDWVCNMRQIVRQAAEAADHAAKNCRLQAAELAAHLPPPPFDKKSKVPCKWFMMGTCRKATPCEFSHDLEDQQPRPLHMKRAVMCKYYEQGECTRGSSCPFAHGEDELAEINRIVSDLKTEKMLFRRHVGR